jgi:putative DNA primase/helicase
MTADSHSTSQPLPLRPLSEIEPKPVHWHWHGWIPKNKLTLIAGPPGVGKSQLLTLIMAAMSCGGRLPDGSTIEAPLRLLVGVTEDDVADTLVPRMMATRADMHQIQLFRERFDITKNLDELKATIRGEAPDFIGLDAFSSFCGPGDRNSEAEARRVVDPLNEIASEFGVTFGGVVHLRKGYDSGASINAIAGSSAWGAAARSAIACVADPDTPGRFQAHSLKVNNAAPPMPRGYAMQSVDVQPGIQCSRLVFDDAPVDHSFQEALAGNRGGGERSEEAREWLDDQLSEGAIKSAELRKRARDEGISWRTVERAKKDLNVRSRKTAGGKWEWEKPPPPDPGGVGGLGGLRDQV